MTTERQRRRMWRPGVRNRRGKQIDWDNLPEGLVLGTMSDEELARRLARHVQGGISAAAVRSARYTRGVPRYKQPKCRPPHRCRSRRDVEIITRIINLYEENQEWPLTLRDMMAAQGLASLMAAREHVLELRRRELVETRPGMSEFRPTEAAYALVAGGVNGH